MASGSAWPQSARPPRRGSAPCTAGSAPPVLPRAASSTAGPRPAQRGDRRPYGEEPAPTRREDEDGGEHGGHRLPLRELRERASGDRRAGGLAVAGAELPAAGCVRGAVTPPAPPPRGCDERPLLDRRGAGGALLPARLSVRPDPRRGHHARVRALGGGLG